MTVGQAAGTASGGWWQGTWFRQIPPHSFALLRIAYGVLGLVRLAGLTPIELHWEADGLVPLPGGGFGLRQWVLDHGLGDVAGWALYGYLVATFGAMTLGYRSEVAVLASFLGLVAETHWNRLPLSSAHAVLLCTMFCLIWAETGGIWSLDARRHAASSDRLVPVPVWPLLLMRWQVAVIYFSTGLWKYLSPAWREGSAVHWAINVNTFQRFPGVLPPSLDPILTTLTWGTLLFELGFPLMVLFRRTRTLALWLGVGLHLGMAVTMELGMFSWVMLASYVAFLDPDRVPAQAHRLRLMIEQVRLRLTPNRSPAA